jgi:hypothetical protein
VKHKYLNRSDYFFVFGISVKEVYLCTTIFHACTSHLLGFCPSNLYYHCLRICWIFVPHFCIIILLQFKRQGNETRCEIESESGGCLAADKNLDGSKHQDVSQKVKKPNGSYQHSVYQDLEKKRCQKRQNTDADEIEEGELIEEDHQDTVQLSKPRKAVLRSVVEASSAAQLETVSAMSKDVGATKECDEKRILAVMEKMQKRRDRFKEPAVAQKEEDSGKAEQLAVACVAEDAKNQRPARKRRWGGNG